MGMLSVGGTLPKEAVDELSEQMDRIAENMGFEKPVILLNRPVETVSADALREVLDEVDA